MLSPSPTYEEIMIAVEAITQGHSDYVTCHQIGLSAQGRPMPLLCLTDPRIDRRHKKVLLVSGGVDGDEEVGRAVALGFARWLVCEEQRHYLQSQVILIAPVCNPDGAVDNLPNKMGNGSGIHPSQLYVPDQEPATPEARALIELVEEWIPDCCIDYHGLAGGGMGESMFLYPTINDKWSRSLQFKIAEELSQVCANAGFTIDGTPKLHVKPRYNLPGWLARNYSTFSMILESTENYYPLADSVRSGLVRLQRLLELSETYDNFQIYQNYPCDIISGNRMGAMLSYGNDYEQRRQSRRALTQMILEGVPRFGRKACDHQWQAVLELPIESSVQTLPTGLCFRATIDKRAHIKSVYWSDHMLEEQLWSLEHTHAGIVVTAQLPESPQVGINQLIINYEVPFKRHVTLAPVE